MGTIANLAVQLSMDAANFERGIGGALAKTEALTDKLANVGRTMTMGVTAPLVGAGAAALKFATDLNAGMANTQSLGLAADRVGELKGNIQEMAVAVGKDTSDLADGLYMVVSAFGDTADTAAILELNAKAAAAGLATTTDAINLTSAVTKGYGDTSAAAVQQASDLAFVTVQLGQTTFPELAASMGRVVPIAASLGVKQEELFGVMATATGVTGSAAEVSTQLRGVLQSLMAPTESMTQLINSMGYETGAALLQQEGLQGSIDAVVAAAEASGAPLQSYIGSIEGQTLALALAGPQADVFTEKLAAVANATGATDAAFAAQTGGVNASGFAMQQLTIKAQVLAQKVGDGLAPALAIVLERVTPLVDWVGNLASSFAGLDANTQTMIVAALGLVAALGPVLAMLPMIATAVGVIASPVGLVIGAVALLGAAWATNFGGIQDATAAAWAVVAPQLQAAYDWFMAQLPGALTTLQTAWTATWTAIQEATSAAWAAIGPSLLSALAWLQTNAPTALTTLQTAWTATWTAIQEAVTTAWASAGPAFSSITTATDGLTAAWESVQPVVAMVAAFMAPAFERLMAAVGGLPGKFGELAPSFAGLGEAFGNLLTALQPLLAVLGAGLVLAANLGINLMAAAFERLPAILGPIIDQAAATINLIATTLSGVIALITALATGDWAAAWESLKGIVDGVITYLTETWTNFTLMLGGLGDVFMNIIPPEWLTAITDWQWPPFPDLPGVVNTLLTWAWPGFPELPSLLNSLVAWAWPGFPEMPGWLEDLLNWKWPSLPALPSWMGGPPGNAQGTNYWRGGPTWVGEQGPELINLPRGTKVYPNDLSMQMAGEAGGGVQITVNANVANELDIRQLAYQLAAEFERWRR